MFKVNVLSLFDGKSSGYTAMELAGIPVSNYYSAEIDKYAIQVSNAIHPNQVRLGDVTKWREWSVDWASIDYLFGGFPCQAWSMAGKQLGDKDERGMLFWVMLDIFKHVQQLNPKVKFLIENVKMKKEFEQYITHHTEQALGKVNKHLINSALVSAQNRNRYYWTNIDGIEHPEDRGVLLKDVIEKDTDDKYILTNSCVNKIKRYNSADKMLSKQDKSLCLVAGYHKLGRDNTYIKCGSMIGRKINPTTGKRDDYNPDLKTEQRLEVRADDKTGTLTTVQKDNLIVNQDRYRKLTPRECFRLQTTPEHYIDKILSCGVSNTQLYKIAGNGWTDEVIAHILRGRQCANQPIKQQ